MKRKRVIIIVAASVCLIACIGLFLFHTECRIRYDIGLFRSKTAFFYGSSVATDEEGNDD